MSNIQKVIDHFKLIKPECASDIFDITIAALEKQVPKKPLKSTLQCRYTYNKYPCCNRLTNGYQYDYCPHCGQKLDWSDSNE